MIDPTLVSWLETIVRKIDAITPQRPPLTRRAFAKAVNLSVRQVGRLIEKREVLVVRNRIPASELSKFLS